MKQKLQAPRYGMGKHQGRPGLWSGRAAVMLIPCKRKAAKAEPVFKAKILLIKHG